MFRRPRRRRISRVLRLFFAAVIPVLGSISLLGSACSGAEPPLADPWVAEHLKSFVALYQDLHTHPELSFQEHQTAKRMAAELGEVGAQVTSGVGKLGVVGVLKNGPGPVVLVRTDMDALPVVEETGLPYASKAMATDRAGRPVGVMHACGHDVHMSCFIGTARWLAEHKDRWSGTVLLVAQPAEEGVGGARAMLADGLYSRFPRPDFAPGTPLHARGARGIGLVLPGPDARQLDVGQHHRSRQRRPWRLAASNR